MSTLCLARRMIVAFLATCSLWNAHANYVLNGSFESATVQGVGTLLDTEIGQARFTASDGGYGTVQSAGVSNWASTGPRMWYMTDLGSEVYAAFPDGGDYAIRLDCRTDLGGTEVLSQSGIPLQSGVFYDFRIETWGEGEFSPTFVTARLVGTGLPTIILLDQQATNGGDGWPEHFTTTFGVSVSGLYPLEISGPNPGGLNNMVWIDDVAIIDVTPVPNAIINPGFELASAQGVGGPVNSELGVSNFTSANSGSGQFSMAGVARWDANGNRIWYMTDLGSGATANFPAGNYAACLDGRADLGGVEVLSQSGIQLRGGGVYRFSLDAWGGGVPVARLNARLVADGRPTISVFSNQPVVANDGAIERLSVEFVVAQSADYRLELNAVDSGSSDNPTWIDNLELVQISPRATVLQGVAVAGGGIQIIAGNTLPGVSYVLQRGGTPGGTWTNTAYSVATSTELVFSDPAGAPRLIYRVVSESP